MTERLSARPEVRTRRRAFWRTGCSLWSTSVRRSWWEDVFTGSLRGLRICTSRVVQKNEATRKTLVEKGVVQRCVCVWWYHLLADLKCQELIGQY